MIRLTTAITTTRQVRPRAAKEKECPRAAKEKEERVMVAIEVLASPEKAKAVKHIRDM